MNIKKDILNNCLTLLMLGAILIIQALFCSFLKLPTCLIKLIFGIPCPSCGLTRSLLALLKLNIEQAFNFHPLWPFLFFFIIVYILQSVPFFNRLIHNKVVVYFFIFIVLGIYVLRFIVLFNTEPMTINNKAFLIRIITFIIDFFSKL